jgi:hypothetical protein
MDLFLQFPRFPFCLGAIHQILLWIFWRCFFQQLMRMLNEGNYVALRTQQNLVGKFYNFFFLLRTFSNISVPKAQISFPLLLKGSFYANKNFGENPAFFLYKIHFHVIFTYFIIFYSDFSRPMPFIP